MLSEDINNSTHNSEIHDNNSEANIDIKSTGFAQSDYVYIPDDRTNSSNSCNTGGGKSQGAPLPHVSNSLEPS